MIVAETPIFAVTGVELPLEAAKAGIVPFPDIPNPIFELLVQVKVGIPPLAEVTKLNPVWLAPEQTVSLLIAFTTGVGFTVMVKVTGEPLQPDPLRE